MQKLDHPPRLAVGNHPHSKIYMCAMNVIAWEQGGPVTDYPQGVAFHLAKMVQIVNDLYCTHTTHEVEVGAHHLGPMGRLRPTSVEVLCVSCAEKVLTLAHRVVDTASATGAQGWLWAARMLTGEQGLVRHVNGSEAKHVEAASVAAVQRANGTWKPTSAELPSLRHGVVSLMASNAANGVLTGINQDHILATIAGSYVHAAMYAGMSRVAEHRERMLAAANYAVDAWHEITRSEKTADAPGQLIAA